MESKESEKKWERKEQHSAQEGAEKGKARSQKRTVAILVAVIVVLIAVIIGLILYFMPHPEEEATDKPTLITEENADTIVGELEDDSADTMFNCRMTYDWSFNGKKSENAYVANTTLNHYPIYFEVRDDDSQEIIYQSDTIPVGSEINGITLKKKLSMGTHPATVIYHLVDEDGEEVSSTAFTITIQVVGN